MARKSNDNIDPSTYEDVTNTDPKTSAYRSSRKTPKPKVGDRVKYRGSTGIVHRNSGVVTGEGDSVENTTRTYNTSNIDWDEIGPVHDIANQFLIGPEGEEYKSVYLPPEENREPTDAERRYHPSYEELTNHLTTYGHEIPYTMWDEKPHPDFPPKQKSIPGDLNWLQEEGEEMEHPQLKMCKDCSDFLRKLSTERAFGDPHRQMAQQYYAKLSDMAGVKMDPQGSGEGSAMSPQTYDDWMTDVGEWHNPDGTEATDYMDDGPIELNPDWDVGQNDYKAARKPRAPKPITYEDMQALRDPDEGAQFIPDYDDPEIEQTLNTMYRTPTGKPKSPKAQERVTQQALRALRDPSDPTPKPKKARDSRAAAQARRVPPEALTPQALEGLKDLDQSEPESEPRERRTPAQARWDHMNQQDHYFDGQAYADTVSHIAPRPETPVRATKSSEEDDYTEPEDYGGMYRERSPGPVPASNTRPMTEDERAEMILLAQQREDQAANEFHADDPRRRQRHRETVTNMTQRMNTPTENLGGRPIKKLAKKSLGDVLNEQNHQLEYLQKTLEALNSVL